MLTYTPRFLPNDRDTIEVARETADGRTLRPIRFVSSPVLLFGDYAGAGAVGVANVRVLSEDPALRDRTMEVSASRIDNPYFSVDIGREVAFSRLLLIGFGFDATQAYIRQDADDVGGYTASLSDYPSLDDEAVSGVEWEWESEAVESWAADDLVRGANTDELVTALIRRDPVRVPLWFALHPERDDAHGCPMRTLREAWDDPTDDASQDAGQWYNAIAAWRDEWLDQPENAAVNLFGIACEMAAGDGRPVEWEYEQSGAYTDVVRLVPYLLRTMADALMREAQRVAEEMNAGQGELALDQPTA